MANKIAEKVALGATVVTLAAGAVALSDKNNRKKLAKEAQKMNKRMESVRDRYQAYQHRIGKVKKALPSNK